MYVCNYQWSEFHEKFQISWEILKSNFDRVSSGYVT